MKFDVSPSGMHQTGQKATSQGQDLVADVKTLLGSLEEAAGTCGGPIANELARLAGDVSQKTHVMSSRVQVTVDGAGKATNAHVEGDHEMQNNARQNQSGTENAGQDMPGHGAR